MGKPAVGRQKGQAAGGSHDLVGTRERSRGTTTPTAREVAGQGRTTVGRQGAPCLRSRVRHRSLALAALPLPRALCGALEERQQAARGRRARAQSLGDRPGPALLGNGGQTAVGYTFSRLSQHARARLARASSRVSRTPVVGGRARGAKDASRGICSPMNRLRPKSRLGRSPSPTSRAGKLRNSSAFRKPNCSLNPCVCATGSRAANCSCWLPWPIAFSSGCWLPAYCWLALACCFTGSHAPTGGSGPPNFLSIGSVGRSVGFGSPILPPSPDRAGGLIVPSPISPGRPVHYVGG